MQHGAESLRVQIKGRAIFREHRGAYRLGKLKRDQSWDAILLVIMNGRFEPGEIRLARREEIEGYLASARTTRGSLSVARIRNIGELVWTAAGVSDDGYWCNTG